jgi:crotonobetainyl-CoA:carnitine CoA-transferase CaiB-like acyl-CoA transferase
VIDFPGSPGGVSSGPDLRGPSALYRIYDAADGWIFLAAPQPREWDVLTDALAPYLPLEDDVRFSSETHRVENDASLAAVLGALFVKRSSHDWQADLTAKDVACVAVTIGPPEALLMSDEIGRASGYITDITHPVFDEHPRLAPLVRFSRSSTQANPGGLCGDSTDAVLAELGYTAEQITDLRTRKVVA